MQMALFRPATGLLSLTARAVRQGSRREYIRFAQGGAVNLQHLQHFSGSVSPAQERDSLEKDVMLNKFLTKTYVTTGTGIVGYFAAASLVSPLALSPLMTLGLGFVGAMGSSVVINASSPQFVREEDGGIVAKNSLARQIAFGGLFTSFGILSAPVITFMMAHNPTIVGGALCASTATMAGASAYALTTKRDITVFGSALTGGLLGIITVSLGGLGAGYMGYPALASSLHSFTTYGSVLIFTGLTAYDTQVAIRMAQAGQPDHLKVSADLFMNFANLFQSFMSIFYNNDN